MGVVVEICCGSYYDAKQAALGGAKRIELNAALMLGGLTPTAATVAMVKEDLDVKVISMVRPRGAGFCYLDEEFAVMERECREVLEAGADGTAFGCLKEDGSLDIEKNKRLLDIIKGMGREAVFHRAFDCCADPFATMEQLIGLGVDRVLTSGLKPKAAEGREMLKSLQERFGRRIQILAGSGVNGDNAKELVEYTGISQVHSSCKAWLGDPTTVKNGVSYSVADGDLAMCYDVVSRDLVRYLVDRVS
ncbi:MAG: copper homeostasis protein CutC [Hungatella sp.]|jgi:copper homeostasis protein|nr:copper homeostasis protein CutC [Hungatella sp.]